MMASESSSSSKLLFGTTEGAANMELMTNSQQESPDQQDHSILAPKKKRNQPQASYPNADVIAVSPTTLLDSNRFLCEVCYKGFSRKQNLTLHRRAHNLPFNLKTTSPKDPVQRKVYLCPEPTCIHHNRSHALGDFGGVKKHYLRKHCTDKKKYKCDTCYKAYSVESDLRAHSKICSRKKYMCHCGCGFSRRYNFTVVGAAKDPQTLDMGDGSVKNISQNNVPICSSMSHPPTLGMGDNTIRINRSESSNIFIGPSISSLQNHYPCTTQYQSQLCQFGADHSSLMTYPSISLNSTTTPAFISPTSINHNQQGCPKNLDIGLYADLLKGKIPLQNVNLGMSLMGDCGYIYGPGEGSKSSLDDGFVLDPSNSLNLTSSDARTTSLDGMLNPLTGSSDVVMDNYEQRCSSGYDNGSGHLDYRGGMEVLNYETSATTTGSLASYEHHPNQQGFWF